MPDAVDRPYLAADHPQVVTPIETYMVYWFAEPDAAGRTGFCSCPDYFKRNVLPCAPSYLCKHLRNLAARSGLILRTFSEDECPVPTVATHSRIDLADYTLVLSDRSRCPECDRYVYLLSPITPGARTFFLCLCGRIAQAGHPEPIAISLE